MSPCVFAGLFIGAWVVFMAWLLWQAARVENETEELVEECEMRIAKQKEETQDDK